MAWTRQEIAGKPAHVFDLPAGERPRFGLLFLPDVDDTCPHSSVRFAELCAQARVSCICPHGGRSFWLDRICPEFDPDTSAEEHLLKNVLPAFAARWGVQPPGIAVMGFGMGGQGALRLSFRHPQVFRVAAGIASCIEFQELYYADTPLMEIYDSKEQCRQDTALMHIQPFHPPPHIYFCCDPDDFWHRGNDRLHEKLGALGVEHFSELATEAGGHSWEYFDRMLEPAMQFLIGGLEKESRRLI